MPQDNTQIDPNKVIFMITSYAKEMLVQKDKVDIGWLESQADFQPLFLTEEQTNVQGLLGVMEKYNLTYGEICLVVADMNGPMVNAARENLASVWPAAKLSSLSSMNGDYRDGVRL